MTPGDARPAAGYPASMPTPRARPLTNAERQRRLTAKQRRFVDEYLVDLCAAGAARRAGVHGG